MLQPRRFLDGGRFESGKQDLELLMLTLLAEALSRCFRYIAGSRADPKWLHLEVGGFFGV